MNTKVTIKFKDGTTTEIWAGEIKYFHFEGYVLEMKIIPNSGVLVSAYSTYTYKNEIIGVEIEHDE